MGEKEHNEQVIRDCVSAAEAVKRAMSMLREFYARQGAAMLQDEQVPEMKEFKGQYGSGGGVIGLLEVIDSDLVTMKAETEAEERQVAAEYDVYMRKATETKEAKQELEVQTKLEKDQV